VKQGYVSSIAVLPEYAAWVETAKKAGSYRFESIVPARRLRVE